MSEQQRKSTVSKKTTAPKVKAPTEPKQQRDGIYIPAPPTAKKTKRDKFLSICINQEEGAMLDALTETWQMKRSDLIRYMITMAFEKMQEKKS